MDEPQLETAIEESESEKTNISDVFRSLTDENDLEKQMDVDEAFSSSAIDQSAIESTSYASPKSSAQEEGTVQPEAGTEPTEDISMSFGNENESIEQVDFSKTAEETQFEDTINNTDVDYTEASINISQLNVEQNDDSNDAFNELKRTETDALHDDTHVEEAFNEEVSQEKKEPQSELPPSKEDESVSTAETVEPTIESQLESPEATETPMESDDVEQKGDAVTEINDDNNDDDDDEQNLQDAVTETQEQEEGDIEGDVEESTQTDTCPDQNEDGNVEPESVDKSEEPEEGNF
jgi:hypothetical protein